MSFSIGIVGLPNVGKSTLFQALTKKQVDAQNYPFCTIDPNIGVVPVPDPRLDALAKLSASKRIVGATVEFVDIAGLVRGAHKGEGLGNQFLSHIREVDAICHLLRFFKDDNVIHVSGKVDPLDDLEVISLELAMADLQTATKRREAMAKKMKSGEKEAVIFDAALQKILESLKTGKPAREVVLDEKELPLVQQLQLLTMKPVMYVVNVSEGMKREDLPVEIAALDPLLICAKVESELMGLPEGEVKEYLQAAGITLTGLDQLIVASYKLLNLITFLTTGEKESRAWTVQAGTRAPDAAGVIHTDFIRGFIRADVIPWGDLVAAGSYAAAREQGKVRTEGKDYIVQDGDVTEFKVGV